MARLVTSVVMLLYCVGSVLCAWEGLADVTSSPTTVKEPVTPVIGLAGRQVDLPCDVTPPSGDTVLIVLWYRDGSDTPVYSYDVRIAQEGRRHWSNVTAFAGRAEFVRLRRSATLRLRPCRRSDAALYRCRVDFQFARSRYALVNLTVIVPPTSVRISDVQGVTLDKMVGAFVEGQPLRLTCRVQGGIPRPSVVWISAGLEVSREVRVEGNSLVSEYSIAALTRDDLRRVLTCWASNTNLTEPVTASVVIDMNFAPLSVSIRGVQPFYSAGRRYHLACQCAGSRPPPVITWLLDGTRLTSDTDPKTSHKGNVTMAALSVVLRPEHNGKPLLCHCRNPKLAGEGLQDKIILSVHYLPTVSIALSKLLNPSRIKEGDDVYFECNITANPPVFKKEWRHNKKVLEHSARTGIILSNLSLALQGVKRANAGVYSCVGFNTEGDTESNPLLLDVKYAPVCKSGLKRIYGAAKGERLNILCDVEANPPLVTFSWTFNNTSDKKTLPEALFNSSNTRSTLAYRPNTEMDYGTVYCRADNSIGSMIPPCVFHIIAAGPPDPVYNCTVQNSTSSALRVQCLEGFDGGVNQSFLLNVYAEEERLVFSRSSPSARWWVDGLGAGRHFRLQALAQNSKGRSQPEMFSGRTRPAPANHPDAKPQDFTIAEILPEPPAVSPLMAVLAGVLGSLTLFALAAVLACLACRRRQPPQLPPARKQAATELEEEEDGDKGPDVVAEAGSGETSYEVYQIPRHLPTSSTGRRETSVYGTGPREVPMRMLNHIAPPCSQRAVDIYTAAAPERLVQQATPVYATVDRRRTAAGRAGAVTRLHGVRPSDTRTPLVTAGDGESSL